MTTALLDALSLVGPGGLAIIAATIASLVAALAANLFLRARYRAIQRDLEGNPGAERPFLEAVLNRIVRSVKDARRSSRDINAQAIVEDSFRAELKGSLLAERFVRSATGLVIILGLLGTFYGLTLSIGKLVGLVSGDAAGGADVAQVVTTGLTQSLSGMSVAFSNSLFGIFAAVLLTIVGIVSNVTDRRTALMVQIETYVDRLLADGAGGFQAGFDVQSNGVRLAPESDKLERVVADFGQSIARLEGAVARFDSALQTFASTTRDFKEFNLHLKDNVQRMSLSFGDFSETLKSQIGAIKSHDRS